MLKHLQPIANEFDSYLQDRALRVGYSVRMLPADTGWELPGAATLALVEFADALPGACADDYFTQHGMQARHDRCHVIAWAGGQGALVQVNTYRHEACGGHASGHTGQASRVGARAFAEAFFASPQAHSLPPAEFRAYLDWLAAEPRHPRAGGVALAILAPGPRQLALVRFPSVTAVRDWLLRAEDATDPGA